jgi:hypothetical protein
VSNIDNKQDDTNILRIEDIVPPYNKEKPREQNLPTTKASQIKNVPAQNGQNQTLKEAALPLSASQAQHAETGATESIGVVQKANEIPKFDLAEQIMAEQRKITAIRRKAPSQKTNSPDRQPQIKSTGYAIEPPQRVLLEKDLIIVEIVARDIEKLYGSDSLNIRNY